MHSSFLTSSTVRRLLNANAPLDWPDEDGWIPLYTACANQQLSCLRLLLTALVAMGRGKRDI